MRAASVCGLIFQAAATLLGKANAREKSHQQRPLDGASAPDAATEPRQPPAPVALAVFSSLERFSRLVDVTYCVGNAGTGITPPFSCASRCDDFPEMRLISTWNTGVLMRDSCGYIAVDDSAREIIVAFRGTYSIANTVADLSTIPQKYVPYEPGDGDGDGDNDGDDGKVKCANCTVHMGFLDSWESTRPLVLPVVAAVRNQSMANSSNEAPYRVQLVGHSLGGAVAALAALEMKAVLGWEDVWVTTFGEPRIGNSGLATFLEMMFDLRPKNSASTTTTAGDMDTTPRPSTYRRVTHKNDPVPLLPISEWGFRSHAGEIYIAKANLSPEPKDVLECKGRSDPGCITGGGGSGTGIGLIPPRLKLWELFFAHRDYFWRLGLCVPGGDPADWGRGRYEYAYEL